MLLTRTVAIVPTFFVAFYSQINDMNDMNDYLNSIMSLQLPFALIPTIAFTSSKAIMGDFVNGTLTIITSLLLAAVVIGINTYYVVQLVLEKFITNYAVITGVGIFGVFYFVLCMYLFLHMLASLGFCKSFSNSSVSIFTCTETNAPSIKTFIFSKSFLFYSLWRGISVLQQPLILFLPTNQIIQGE